MEFVTLKNSNLKVSRLCIGGCPMGGYGWGKVSESELIAAIHCAIDNGINFFDTADTYGLGQSEINLAKGLGKRRTEVIIESKFGVRIKNGKTFYDNSPDYMQEALEGSLKRLQTDYLDIYVIHYRDDTPIEKVISKLEQFKKEGKIRYYGLSNIHGDRLNELLPYRDKFICCQDEFSLACRNNENDLLNVAKNINVTPMTWGSLGQGILTGKYNKDNINFDNTDRRSREIYMNFHGQKLEQNLKIVDLLKEISISYEKSIPACAIRFILDYIEKSVVLVGVKRIKQVLSNLEALDWKLKKNDLLKLDQISENLNLGV